MIFQDEVFEISDKLEKELREKLKLILLNEDYFVAVDSNNEEEIFATKRKNAFFRAYLRINPNILEDLVNKIRKCLLDYIKNDTNFNDDTLKKDNK